MTMSSSIHIPSRHSWTEQDRNAKPEFEFHVNETEVPGRDGKCRPYTSIVISTGTGGSVTVFIHDLDHLSDLAHAAQQAYTAMDDAELRMGVSDRPIEFLTYDGPEYVQRELSSADEDDMLAEYADQPF